MLVRHAEKPLGAGPPHGVTIDGTPDPESLTPRGWQRAGALVALFVGDGRGRSLTVPTPTHLFASKVAPDSSSARPQETLAPLSERLGVAVDTHFRKQQLPDLVQAIEATDGIVLVSWEHHLIPGLARMLVGESASVPEVWPDDRYDVVWVLEGAGGSEGRRLRQVPEMVLAGDRPDAIAAAPMPDPVRVRPNA